MTTIINNSRNTEETDFMAGIMVGGIVLLVAFAGLFFVYIFLTFPRQEIAKEDNTLHTSTQFSAFGEETALAPSPESPGIAR